MCTNKKSRIISQVYYQWLGLSYLYQGNFVQVVLLQADFERNCPPDGKWFWMENVFHCLQDNPHKFLGPTTIRNSVLTVLIVKTRLILCRVKVLESILIIWWYPLQCVPHSLSCCQWQRHQMRLCLRPVVWLLLIW